MAALKCDHCNKIYFVWTGDDGSGAAMDCARNCKEPWDKPSLAAEFYEAAKKRIDVMREPTPSIPVAC